MYRANGTGKSSVASLPFLNARMASHWSPQLLQPHARSKVIRHRVKFQEPGEILSWRRSGRVLPRNMVELQSGTFPLLNIDGEIRQTARLWEYSRLIP